MSNNSVISAGKWTYTPIILPTSTSWQELADAV
jgi:hypothetical protein